MDFQKLAALLRLNGPKLAAFAKGWRPPAIDLGTWRELRQIATTQGGNTVNCFLIWDEVCRVIVAHHGVPRLAITAETPL